MVLLEAIAIAGLVGLLVYATIQLVTRPSVQRRRATQAGQWQAAHYDLKGQTLVVVQKVTPGGRDVLDEHIIATIAVDDPEYDAKFLSAMSAARERRALFDSEEDA